MQSDFSPPLTRLDVVLWFLRVQLWVSIIVAIGSSFSFISYMRSPFGNSLFAWRFVGVGWAPVLVLSLFASVLASSALGGTARNPINSLADVHSLVGRCVGLMLLVSSLGNAALFSGLFLYGLLQGNMMQQFGSATSGYISLTQFMPPVLSLFLGFALAFGPVIRENFRVA